MNNTPKLIVMLTKDDRTVRNAREIFEQCRETPAAYWGCKEQPLPLPEMRALFSEMRQCGKHTVLEVVEYDEENGLRGAELAAECGAEILMGTCFYDSVSAFCRASGMRYMPFVGEVYGRPSVLTGDPDAIAAQARQNIARGADGVDLLGYRFTGDAAALNKRLVAEVNAPVCIAGSIDSYARIDEVLRLHPWGFTIGSALFEHRFGETVRAEIEAICAYIESKAGVEHDRTALPV